MDPKELSDMTPEEIRDNRKGVMDAIKDQDTQWTTRRAPATPQDGDQEPDPLPTKGIPPANTRRAPAPQKRLW